MAENAILRLTADDLWLALEEFDPTELMLTRYLSRKAEPASGNGSPNARFVPRTSTAAGGLPVGSVLFDDGATGVRCALPSYELHLIQVAALTAMATSALLITGEATVALLASGEASRCHLTVLSRCVRGIGHVALVPAADPEPVVADLLDRVDIALSPVATVGEAMLGANLVIATGPGHELLTYEQLARGALVVNAAGRDLPVDVVNRVDHVFVDDARLLDSRTDREFVRMHRKSAHDESVSSHESEGWHRPEGDWRHGRRVDADLAQVLSGEHPGRTRSDDILLFEPLSAQELDITLAGQLLRIALDRGLGVRLPRPVQGQGD
jgi:ornithine cyclodeaminase/alanine dehydrogenase-like protein (mu-crystallin family)